MRSLVSSRMLDRLGGFYPSRATIQASVPTRTPSGGVASTWADLAGLTAIPCALAPIAGGEMRSSTGTTAETTHTASLQGRYVAITVRHRAVVDGIPYDITAAQTDSHGLTTRLQLRLVAPSAEAS